MYYLESGNIITDLEGLRDEVSDPTYQAVIGLHQDAVDQLKYQNSILDAEVQLADSRMDECKSELNSAYNLLEELSDVLEGSKRLNRAKLMDFIQEIKNHVENGIDA